MNNATNLPFERFKRIGIIDLSEILEYDIASEDGYGVSTHTIQFKGGARAVIHIDDSGRFNASLDGLDSHVTQDGQVFLTVNKDNH